MSHFYMTLPSNSSMDCYPDNTAAKYTTKLTSMIELDGEWEVGLIEISCPGSLVNVRQNRYTFSIVDKELNVVKRFSMRKGYYRNIAEIVEGLNETIRVSKELKEVLGREETPLLAYFQYHESVQRKDYAIQFNLALARKIGIGRHSVIAGTTLGRVVSDDRPHARSLYVYCDLLQAVPVGDVKAPLLRIVNIPDKDESVNLHRTMRRMMYLPIQKKHFDTIEIQIMDDTGTAIPFQDGKSHIVLEFRRTAHPYFLENA